jgi:hypothetical protein
VKDYLVKAYVLVITLPSAVVLSGRHMLSSLRLMRAAYWKWTADSASHDEVVTGVANTW